MDGLRKINSVYGDFIKLTNEEMTDEEIEGTVEMTVEEMASAYIGLGMAMMQMLERHPELAEKKFMDNPIELIKQAVEEYQEEKEEEPE